MKKNFLLLTLFLLLINFNILTFAQQNPAQNQQQGILPLVRCRNCTWEDFLVTIQRLIRALLILGYWITALVCTIGAFLMMLGGYNKNWLSMGRKMMIDGVVYYVILLLSGIIFDLFLDLLRPALYTGG